MVLGTLFFVVNTVLISVVLKGINKVLCLSVFDVGGSCFYVFSWSHIMLDLWMFLREVSLVLHYILQQTAEEETSAWAESTWTQPAWWKSNNTFLIAFNSRSIAVCILRSSSSCLSLSAVCRHHFCWSLPRFVSSFVCERDCITARSSIKRRKKKARYSR